MKAEIHPNHFGLLILLNKKEFKGVIPKAGMHVHESLLGGKWIADTQ